MKQMLEEDKSLSDSFRSMVEIMVFIIELLLNQRTLNSIYSSKPPSTAGVTGNNKKKSFGRKPGGSPVVRGVPLKLGGFTDSKRTGIAGWETLWKGWDKLKERVHGMLMAKQMLAEGVDLD